MTGIILLPYLIAALLNPTLTSLGRAMASTNARSLAYTRLAAILLVLLQSLAQAAILHASFMDLNGHPISAIKSVSQSFRRIFPIIGISVYQGVGMLIGLVLLVIPGLILMTMWYVGLSVCVIEQHGALNSVNRSAALTKGHRWKIFGIIAVVVFGGAVLEGIFDIVVTRVTSHAVFAVADYAFQLVSCHSARSSGLSSITICALPRKVLVSRGYRPFSTRAGWDWVEPAASLRGA